jgi:hypothetical protein
MKAAKRASQIKGFMRFSFFKQALSDVLTPCLKMRPKHPVAQRQFPAMKT